MDTRDYDPPRPLEYSEPKRLGDDYLQHPRFEWGASLNGNEEILIEIRDLLQLDETPSGACFELNTKNAEMDWGEIWLRFGYGAIYLDAYYERYN